MKIKFNINDETKIVKLYFGFQALQTTTQPLATCS